MLTILTIPSELITHVFKCMTSYDRSKICIVSSMFEKLAIEASKSVSFYPQYFDDPDKFHSLVKKLKLAHLDKNRIYDAEVSLRDICHQIISSHDYHLIVRLKSEDIVNRLEYACKIGFTCETNYSFDTYTEGTCYAPIIELCVLHGDQPLSLGVYGACKSGKLRIAKMMFNKIKGEIPYRSYSSVDMEDNFININEIINNLQVSDEFFLRAYYHAGIGGNKEIIDIIQVHDLNRHRGDKSETSRDDVLNAEYVLTGACYGGHVELAKWAIEQGATDFDEGFIDACDRNHLSIIKLLFDKHDNNLDQLDETTISQGLYNATYNGFAHIFNAIIEWLDEFRPVNNVNWSWVLQGACMGKHKANESPTKISIQSVIEIVIQRGATSCGACYESIKSHLTRF